MGSFTDSSGETYTVEEAVEGALMLTSDLSSGIAFYKEDALKIIALITKAAA